MAACLHCKAANRLLGDSQPQPRPTAFPADSPADGGDCRSAAVMFSNSSSSVPSSAPNAPLGTAGAWRGVPRGGRFQKWRVAHGGDSLRANPAFSLSNLGHAETCVKIAALWTADLETVSNEPIFWSHIPLGRGFVRVSAVHRVVSCL